MPELLRPATTALSLGSFTRPPLVFSAVQAVDTAGILANLSQALHRQRCIADWLLFCQTALNREMAFASALPCGLAFPHARLAGVRELQFAVGRLPRAVSWAGRSSCPVSLVFLISVPATEAAVYLRLLASITRLAQRSDHLNRLLAAPGPEQILEALCEVPMDSSGICL